MNNILLKYRVNLPSDSISSQPNLSIIIKPDLLLDVGGTVDLVAYPLSIIGSLFCNCPLQFPPGWPFAVVLAAEERK